MDPTTQYALIKRDIAIAQREAKAEMLKKHGMTKKSLEALEAEVLAALGAGGFVETEFGNIQTLPEDAKIDFRPSTFNAPAKKQKVVFLLTEK